MNPSGLKERRIKGMKKKSSGKGLKFVLVLVFVLGLCMMCNIFMAFEETELIEGVVEHTYMSGATYKVRTIAEVPMCRVVWYDKEGEKVVYGMPNRNEEYEVGDTYYVEVDVETNHYPKKTNGEYIIAFILGLTACIVCAVIWRKKFGTREQNKRLNAIEQRRREAYGLQTHIPVIKCSICNGEQVAGFKERKTGHFTEIMLIQSEKDLQDFKERYGVEEVVKEY